jgi:hypothetical protein
MLLVDVALAKLLRLFLRSKPHHSYVSQSFFYHLVKVLESKNLSLVESHEVSQSQLLDFQGVVVVVSSDDDIDFNLVQLKMHFPQSRIFSVNSLSGDEGQLEILPLGIEDPKWGRNGMPWNFRRSLVRMTKLPKVLVGPFGTTHIDRQALMNLNSSTSIQVISERMASFVFASVSARYMFVACPRGNGLDTHRFWETLYRGSYPVVLQSPWSASLKRRGVPLVEVNRWDEAELNRVVAECSSLPPFDPNEISLLKPEYWERKLRDCL